MRQIHCKALIVECNDLLKSINNKIEEWNKSSSTETEMILPKVKSVLEHLRSILEYCTKDIFELIIPVEERNRKQKSKTKYVYFPYGNSKSIFEKRAKENLPGLSNDNTIYKLIESLQDYNRFNNKRFLSYMCMLTNDNKHDQLSTHRVVREKALHIEGIIKMDKWSEVTIKNNNVFGVPTGNFTINSKGKITGDINPHFRDSIYFSTEGRLLFKDNNNDVSKFLKFCISEIDRFQKTFYKLIDKEAHILK